MPEPRVLDFPRAALPACFHYTGPLRTVSPRVISFPYERLDGRPLVYASLGTLVNRHITLFHTIAVACAGLDVQLLITLGGGTWVDRLVHLPGAPLVVSYAPQFELMEKASMIITHGSINTVLDALSHGVPAVAIPIGLDQPGTAARLQAARAGESVPLRDVTVERLRAAIRRVLHEPSYRRHAERLQQAIRCAGGVSRAAAIVEQAFATHQPVLATRGT
jgi:MGT family glycosyltransferase